MEVVCRARLSHHKNVTWLKPSLLIWEMAIRKASTPASSGEPIGSMAVLPCNTSFASLLYNAHPIPAFSSGEVYDASTKQQKPSMLRITSLESLAFSNGVSWMMWLGVFI